MHTLSVVLYLEMKALRRRVKLDLPTSHALPWFVYYSGEILKKVKQKS